MGKSGKQTKVSHRHGRGRRVSHFGGDDGNDLPSSVYDAPPRYREDIDDGDSNEAAVEDEQEGDAEAGNQDQWQVGSMPSKFHLYQPSVQSPKGDISYLQKFFLMYVDGRVPLYLQEDFCGTALLCTEWLRTDARRTAIDLDLDLEALEWCLENNLNKIGADGYSRMLLFHGNVLHPKEARLVKKKYFWEQEDFDIMSHQTRISLHFLAGKKQMLRHAFTCHWRLWSIPEIKDCLEEAGFKSIHVWIREMPNTQSSGHAKEYDADRDVKYEELQHFNQGDAWNAYVVGVANI